MIRLTFLLLPLTLFSFMFFDFPLSQSIENSEFLGMPIINLLSKSIKPSFHLALWIVAPSICLILNKKNLLSRCLLFSKVIISSYILSAIIKIILARARPSLWISEGISGFTYINMNKLFHSFPSSHTVVAFALASTLSFINKKLIWPSFFLASFLSFTRVILNEHFLSDLFAGAFIGIIIAQLICKQKKMSK